MLALLFKRVLVGIAGSSETRGLRRELLRETPFAWFVKTGGVSFVLCFSVFDSIFFRCKNGDLCCRVLLLYENDDFFFTLYPMNASL